MSVPTLRVVRALQEQRPDVTPMLAHQRGAVLVLEAAERDGLQMPLSVRVDDHAVELYIDTQDVLDEWAIWLDTPVEVTPVIEGLALYTVRARLFEVPVVAQWTEVL